MRAVNYVVRAQNFPKKWVNDAQNPHKNSNSSHQYHVIAASHRFFCCCAYSFAVYYLSLNGKQTMNGFAWMVFTMIEKRWLLALAIFFLDMFLFSFSVARTVCRRTHSHETRMAHFCVVCSADNTRWIIILKMIRLQIDTFWRKFAVCVACRCLSSVCFSFVLFETAAVFFDCILSSLCILMNSLICVLLPVIETDAQRTSENKNN